MALGVDPMAEAFGKVCVNQEAHTRSARADEDGVIDLRGSILDTGTDIRLFQEIIVGKDICHVNAAGQHVENILHAQPIMTDTRSTATLLGIKGNAVKFAGHTGKNIMPGVAENATKCSEPLAFVAGVVFNGR